jgi:hypothetical protein
MEKRKRMKKKRLMRELIYSCINATAFKHAHSSININVRKREKGLEKAAKQSALSLVRASSERPLNVSGLHNSGSKEKDTFQCGFKKRGTKQKEEK